MPDSIQCPICESVSHNPHDIRERYCGRCHQFHEIMLLMRQAELLDLDSRREQLRYAIDRLTYG